MYPAPTPANPDTTSIPAPTYSPIRWLGLSKKGYGIHGTNNLSSIGKAISNGCIRFYNDNVIEVFNLASIGTSVKII